MNGHPKSQPPSLPLRATRACLLVFCIAFGALSCDLSEPDERTLNPAARHLEIGNLDLEGLSPGQHVAGVISIPVDSGLVSSALKERGLVAQNSTSLEFALIIDSDIVQSVSWLPWTFTFDTRGFPEGEHSIAIGVIERGEQGGLLGSLGIPTRIFGIELVFDQTPPTAVQITNLTACGVRPRITWSRNEDANFYAYRVVRATYVPLDTIVVSTILDRAETTFTDTSAIYYPGWERFYAVDVSNRAECALSAPETLRIGREVSFMSRATQSPIRDEFYGLGQSGLEAISSVDFSLLRSGPSFFDDYSIESNGNRIVAIKASMREIVELDAASFSVQRSVSLPDGVFSPFRIAATQSGTLYLLADAFSPDHPDGANLFVIDLSTGEVDTALTLDEQSMDVDVVHMRLSADETSLFVATRAWARKISTVTLGVEAQYSLQNPVRALAVSEDGTKVFVAESAPANRVVMLSASDFALVGQYAPFDPAARLLDGMHVGSTHLFLSYSVPDPTYPFSDDGRIDQIDIASGMLANYWVFQDFVEAFVTRDQRTLIAFYFVGAPAIAIDLP